jgi:hypothetical protein
LPEAPAQWVQKSFLTATNEVFTIMHLLINTGLTCLFPLLEGDYKKSIR